MISTSRYMKALIAPFVIFVLGVIAVALMQGGDLWWQNQLRKNIPLYSNLMQARMYIDKGNLLVERALAGDSSIDINVVFPLFTQAEIAIDDCINGRSTISQMSAVALEEQDILDKLDHIKALISHSMKLARHRWGTKDKESKGDVLEYRSVCYDLEQNVNAVDYWINEDIGHMAVQQRKTHTISMALLLVLTFSACAWIFFFYFGRQQAEVALQKAYDELEQRVHERTAELAKANEQLKHEIAERKPVEEALLQRTHNLGERVKELNCLYGVSSLVEKTDISLDEILQGTIGLIPPAFQYPEITCGRIILEDREFVTENFQDTIWKQSSDIIAAGETIGSIEVCYLEERPGEDEGPFLKEETNLINAITEHLGRTIERKRAEEQVKASLKEKEVLLRELYHRTKNNMQVIMAMLNMQSPKIKDEAALQVIEETGNRIRTMALVHEKLYQTKNLSKIDLEEYANDLLSLLMRSYETTSGRIATKTQMDSVFVTIDSAVPCGLIINELISNSLKYAFPGDRKGEITIGLCKTDNDEIELRVSDNGVGLPDGYDIRKTDSYGLQAVVNLTEHQLQGTVNLLSDKGTSFQIRFKDPSYKERI